MEEPTKIGLGVNVIQALSSSAANASTLSHPVDESQSSFIDSNSTSYSEGDGIENVPPPPPPLGIESQFNVLQISNAEHQSPLESNIPQKRELGYDHYQTSSRKTIFQKLHNLGLTTSTNLGNISSGKQANNEYETHTSHESPMFKKSFSSAQTSSHFATMRKMSNEKRGGFTRGISIEEGLEDSNQTKRQSRASRSSITRKSLTDYNDIEMKGCDYNDDGRGQKARSGSMSSLSSRGSTLSWFRKRSRNQEKGMQGLFFFLNTVFNKKSCAISKIIICC